MSSTEQNNYINKMKGIQLLLIFVMAALLFSCSQKSDKPQQVPYQTVRQIEDSVPTSDEVASIDENKEDSVNDKPSYFAQWNGKFKYFDNQKRALEVQELADLHMKYIIFLRHCNIGNGFNDVYSSINSIQYRDNEYEIHPEVSQTIGTKVLGQISFSVNGLETEEAQKEINMADELVREAILVSDCTSIGRANECLELIRKAETHYNTANMIAKTKERELNSQLQQIFK